MNDNSKIYPGDWVDSVGLILAEKNAEIEMLRQKIAALEEKE